MAKKSEEKYESIDEVGKRDCQKTRIAKITQDLTFLTKLKSKQLKYLTYITSKSRDDFKVSRKKEEEYLTVFQITNQN